MPVDNYTEYYARLAANDSEDLEEEYQVRVGRGGEGRGGEREASGIVVSVNSRFAGCGAGLCLHQLCCQALHQPEQEPLHQHHPL